MPVDTQFQVLGANEAIRALNKIEPGLRKQFALEITQIAKPAIDEASSRYGNVGWGSQRVTGIARKWAGPAVSGRQVFPWSVQKAQKGLKIRLDSDRRSTAVILIEQRDAGTAILESAGRATNNSLGNALGAISPNRTRILGPSLFAKREQVQEAIRRAMLDVVRRVQKEAA